MTPLDIAFLTTRMLVAAIGAYAIYGGVRLVLGYPNHRPRRLRPAAVP